MVLQRLISLITNAAHLRRKIAPEQSLLDAKYALAERMLAAGIDDGYLGGVINSLDAEIAKHGASDVRARTLLAERRSLLLRLAEAALEFDAPLPGAQAEYDKARACEAACDAAGAASHFPLEQAMPRFQVAARTKAVSNA